MSQTIIDIQGTLYQATLTGTNEPSSASQAFPAATFAAVPVPANAIGVYIIPPDSNAGTITVKGATGDTGHNIPQAIPSFMSLDPAGTSFGLQCANSITVSFIWV